MMAKAVSSAMGTALLSSLWLIPLAIVAAAAAVVDAGILVNNGTKGGDLGIGICNVGVRDGEGKSSCNTADNEAEEWQEHEPADVAFCRRHPTWRGERNTGDLKDNRDGGVGVEEEENLLEKCNSIMGYQPDPHWLTAGRHPVLSSTYDVESWKSDSVENPEDKYDRLPVMERPLMQKLLHCMDSEMDVGDNKMKGDNDMKHQEEHSAPLPESSISGIYNRKDGRGPPVMVTVAHALNDEEARSVLQLSECLKTHVPNLFERRKFEETYEGGGNDVVYMAGFLQLLVPGVAIQLKRVLRMVWEEAGWGTYDRLFKPADYIPHEPRRKEDEFDHHNRKNEARKYSVGTSKYSLRWWPDPNECGIRTTEHLSYDKWGALGYHKDQGSDYTVLIALSHPEDYDGGEFTIFPSKKKGDRLSIKPNKFEAIVFLSETPHGVEEIRSPGRKMFTSEFWRYDDVPAMHRRPPEEVIVFGDPENNFVSEEDDDSDDGSEDLER